MCGRFTLRAPASVIAEEFSLFDVPPLEPRYNIAPTQMVAAVRMNREAVPPQREFAWFRWGLIPSWADDPAIGNRMINARSETVAEKPAFRAALRKRRCLIVADGFYEWQKSGREKQPYFIRLRSDRPFAFAGLWEFWEGPDNSAWESCTILTTDANDLMRPIHERMPVILAAEDYRRWLDPAVQDSAAVTPLLRPFPSKEMLASPVSPYVNSPSHENPRCIEALA
jgi:putative SOS response-associated peptidase YedK